MSKLKKIESLNVVGYKWFQKSYGNTYNVVQFWINGEYHYLEFSYGYGEFYLQRITEFLIKNGYIDSKLERKALWSICNELNIKFTYKAIDVERKKDLPKS